MNIDSISPLLIQQVLVIPLIASPSTDLNNPSWTSVRNYVQHFYDYNQTICYDTKTVCLQFQICLGKLYLIYSRKNISVEFPNKYFDKLIL